MRPVNKIVFVLVLLTSCHSSVEIYSSRLDKVDISNFYNFSVWDRGTYLLVQSEFDDTKFSCIYFIHNQTYKFPAKVDSLLHFSEKDSIKLVTSLNSSINDYLKLGAVRIHGSNQIIRIYFSERDLFVGFAQHHDSLTIANYFDKVRYTKIDTLYYCKPKNQLKLF